LVHFGRSYIVEQNMVQRYLVARSDREAQRAVLAGAGLCVAIWVTFTFIGSCLWAFYRISGASLPAEILNRPDNILPYFVATELPAGLIGLVLAGILAAAMQSFSADLTSIATVATEDYYRRFFRGTSDMASLRFCRLAVVLGGLAAIGVALQLSEARLRALYEAFVVLAMVLAGGLLGLFALGFLSRRSTRRGAYIGIGACVLFVAWATATGPLRINLRFNFTMHPLMIGVLSQFVLFGIGFAASFVPDHQSPSASGLTIWELRGVRDPKNFKA
jgi:SSS family solute:Na+ symporter